MNIGRGKVAGYKLHGHATLVERRNFFSRYDNDCFKLAHSFAPFAHYARNNIILTLIILNIHMHD